VSSLSSSLGSSSLVRSSITLFLRFPLQTATSLSLSLSLSLPSRKLIISFSFFTELKGLTLEEMDALFGYQDFEPNAELKQEKV